MIGKPGGSRDRIEFGPRPDADHEQRIDARRLVGPAAGDRIVEAADLHGAGAAGDGEQRILAAGQRRLHLADALGDRGEAGLGRAVRRRQVGVLDAHAGNARRLELLDRAFHIERIAVAVVGVDHQRQAAGAVDAVGLGGELAQGQHDQVGGAQHGERGGRAREHAELEAEVLGDPGGDRVVHRAGMDAAAAVEDGAEALAAVGPMHVDSPLFCRPASFRWANRALAAGPREIVAFLTPARRRRDVRRIKRTGAKGKRGS